MDNRNKRTNFEPIKDAYADLPFSAKIAQYAMTIIFSAGFSGAIAFGVLYWILQIPYNLNITACIAAAIAFIVTFRFWYSQLRKSLWHPGKNYNDFSPGNIHDRRNPFSYTTPGGVNYIPDHSNKDFIRENKSPFSD